MTAIEIILTILVTALFVCAIGLGYTIGSIHVTKQAEKMLERTYDDMGEWKEMHQEIMKAYNKLLDKDKET